MPLASAALTAEANTRLPITHASLTPPCERAKPIASLPGRSRDPDTIAARVSSRWCLVFSATAGGRGLRSARAMYSLRRCITGDTGGEGRMAGILRDDLSIMEPWLRELPAA